MIGIALFLLSADAYNVELVGCVKLGGYLGKAMSISKDGRVAYISLGSRVAVIDISDPRNPYLYKVITHDSLRGCIVGPVVDTFLYLKWSDWYPAKNGAGTYVVDWRAYNLSPFTPPLFPE